jgi:hypothetical protein
MIEEGGRNTASNLGLRSHRVRGNGPDIHHQGRSFDLPGQFGSQVGANRPVPRSCDRLVASAGAFGSRSLQWLLARPSTLQPILARAWTPPFPHPAAVTRGAPTPRFGEHPSWVIGQTSARGAGGRVAEHRTTAVRLQVDIDRHKLNQVAQVIAPSPDSSRRVRRKTLPVKVLGSRLTNSKERGRL